MIGQKDSSSGETLFLRDIKPTGPWGLPLPPCLIVQPKLILALRSASQPIFVGDSQTSLSKKTFLQLPSKFVSSLTLFVNQIKYLHFSKKIYYWESAVTIALAEGRDYCRNTEKLNFFCFGFFTFSVELIQHPPNSSLPPS